jgi:hypothetical protein
LRLVDFRLVQLAGFREREQCVVGPLAPEEKREPPRELEIAHGVRVAGLRTLGCAAGLRAIEEFRAREDRHHALLHAGLEAADRAALLVERE